MRSRLTHLAEPVSRAKYNTSMSQSEHSHAQLRLAERDGETDSIFLCDTWYLRCTGSKQAMHRHPKRHIPGNERSVYIARACKPAIPTTDLLRTSHTTHRSNRDQRGERRSYESTYLSYNDKYWRRRVKVEHIQEPHARIRASY